MCSAKIESVALMWSETNSCCAHARFISSLIALKSATKRVCSYGLYTYG